MMMTVRSYERGATKLGWLDSHHTFSFAGYYNPNALGFGFLKVLNEDCIMPNHGFGTHPHKDMEIISYILEGGMDHVDSKGHEDTIKAGEVQLMSAGTGISHSEMNHYPDTKTHMFQIWIEPRESGVKPSYQSMHLGRSRVDGEFSLLISPNGEGDSLQINQDAYIYELYLKDVKEVDRPLELGREAWVQVIRGEVMLNGVELKAGDGVGLHDVLDLRFEKANNAVLLLFDMASR